MAKGQKRSGKEARKQKDPQKAANKPTGPKYLREAEVLQTSKVGALRLGRK
jgi:hypothetical protein